MTTSQPRQPKGQPVGGQFAGKQQTGDEVGTLGAGRDREAGLRAARALDRIADKLRTRAAEAACQTIVEYEGGELFKYAEYIFVHYDQGDGDCYVESLGPDGAPEGKTGVYIASDDPDLSEFFQQAIVPDQFRPDNGYQAKIDAQGLGGFSIDARAVRAYDSYLDVSSVELCDEVAHLALNGIDSGGTVPVTPQSLREHVLREYPDLSHEQVNAVVKEMRDDIRFEDELFEPAATKFVEIIDDYIRKSRR